MRRRTVLATVGACLASLAGCAAGGDFEQSPAATSRPSPGTSGPTPDYPRATNDLQKFDPEYTETAVSVGSREGVANPGNNEPHDVQIWNATPEPRDVELRVVDRSAVSVALDETYLIPADASLSLSLLEPSDYLVEVRVPAEDVQETLGVPRHSFDCNISATQIGIFEGGRIESRVVSTLLACSTATHSTRS